MALKPTRTLFFQKFQKIPYAFIDDPKDSKFVTNILSAFHLKRMKSNKSLIFQSYTLKDTDTPEKLALDLFQNYQYYWTTLVLNGIIDPFYEWVMDNETLVDFTTKKYVDGIPIKLANGTTEPLLLSEGLNGIHHFINVDLDNLQVDEYDDRFYRELYDADPTSIGDNIVPVTNLTYEQEINLSSRIQSIVNPRLISTFVESYNKMIQGKV
jgi:hypothetical protein